MWVQKEPVCYQHLLRICVLLVLSLLLSSCASNSADLDTVQQIQKAQESNAGDVAADPVLNDSSDKLLEVKVFVVDDARSLSFVSTAVTAVEALFRKCQITLSATISSIELAPDTSIDEEARDHIVAQYGVHKPALFVIPATAEQDVAFSYLPSLIRGVAATSWLTERVSDRCFVWIMAHELGHVIFDHAKHSSGSSNIMSVACKQKNWGSRRISPDWTDEQCIELRDSKSIRSNNVSI